MISVCIATYNGEKFIVDQLRSILSQLAETDEIVVSDDQSSDSTLKLIKEIDDDRIKVFLGPCLGLIKNFENALLYAKGDYIFLSDQDDIWESTKVIEYMHYFDSGCYDLILSDCSVVDENLSVISPSFFSIRGKRDGVLLNVYKNSYIGCCMAFKKCLIEKCTPFPSGVPMHDWWIGLCAELDGRVYFLNKPLIKYRRHGGNVSLTGGGTRLSLLRGVKDRIMIVSFLLKRMVKNRLC